MINKYNFSHNSDTPLPVATQNHLELPPSFFIPDTPINRIMATGAKNGQNAQTLTSGSAEAEVVEQTPIEEMRAGKEWEGRDWTNQSIIFVPLQFSPKSY
jgi:hypothetical protein